MNGILILVSVSFVCKFVGGFAMVPQIIAEKGIQSDISHQSLQAVLQSIESRIQNIESAFNVQCSSLLEGKIDYYGRKVENIEKYVARFEAHVRIEMDKILENISNKNYKEDITKDQTIRKIDGVNDRLNHKLSSIEGQIDVNTVKYQNAHEKLMSKLDKIEEKINIRDGDLEAEIVDAVAAMDDLKTSCTNIEETLVNLTRDSLKAIVKNGDKSSKKQFGQAINIFEDVAKNISAEVLQLQKTIDNSSNHSYDIRSINKVKTDLEESINEFANKVTNMYTDLWKKSDVIESTVKNMAVIANITRTEQQNGLRALMVQVGRKTSKNTQNDSIADNYKIKELISKIDSNFENVMLAQNLFLESCHRVQMDESQLESQISLVLEKLIDTFENKTVLEPKHIKHLEHLIRNHDSNIRKSIYQITSHLLNLIQKNSDNKDEIVDYIKSQLLHLDALNIKQVDQESTILHELQVMQQALTKSQVSLAQMDIINSDHTKKLNASESTTTVNLSKLDEVLNYMKQISNTLNLMEIKINTSHFGSILNKYNGEIDTDEVENKLKAYIQWISEQAKLNSSLQEYSNSSNWNLNITQVFLKILSSKQHVKNQYGLEDTDSIEKIVLLCNNEHNNSNSNLVNMTQHVHEENFEQSNSKSRNNLNSSISSRTDNTNTQEITNIISNTINSNEKLESPRYDIIQNYESKNNGQNITVDNQSVEDHLNSKSTKIVYQEPNENLSNNNGLSQKGTLYKHGEPEIVESYNRDIASEETNLLLDITDQTTNIESTLQPEQQYIGIATEIDITAKSQYSET